MLCPTWLRFRRYLTLFLRVGDWLDSAGFLSSVCIPCFGCVHMLQTVIYSFHHKMLRVPYLICGLLCYHTLWSWRCFISSMQAFAWLVRKMVDVRIVGVGLISLLVIVWFDVFCTCSIWSYSACSNFFLWFSHWYLSFQSNVSAHFSSSWSVVHVYMYICIKNNPGLYLCNCNGLQSSSLLAAP